MWEPINVQLEALHAKRQESSRMQKIRPCEADVTWQAVTCAVCMMFTGHLHIDVTERHSRPGAFFQACCLALEAMTQGSS